MNRGPTARAVIVCSAFLVTLVLPALAGAQDQAQTANISVSMAITTRNGITSTSVTGGVSLKPGETRTQYLYASANSGASGVSSTPPAGTNAGGDVGAGGVPVAGGVVTSPPPVPRPGYDYLWQVDVKAVAIAIDLVTFDLDWKRTEVRDGSRQTVVGDHRTITLRQDERHVLDFVACSPDARFANVLLEIRASPVEDASVADLSFSYDLWLVHQTSDGAKVTRHAVVTGRQGQKVNFAFASVPLALDAAAAPDADSPFRMLVTGTIVGRQRPDGTIEVAVRPMRAHRSPTGGVSSGGGAKTFLTRTDETTSIAFPAESGYSGWRPGPGFTLASPKPGVTMNGDLLRVNLKPFFEGTSTSILVTVHREK